jgi:hypothetical protein
MVPSPFSSTLEQPRAVRKRSPGLLWGVGRDEMGA